MTPTELRLQDQIMDYNLMKKDITKLEQEINMLGISVTASYSASGISAKGGVSNRIEDFCIRKEKKEAELRRLRRKVEEVDALATTFPMTDTEKAIMHCLLNGLSLRKYAIDNGIYVSYIYKIKDALVKKMAKKLSKDHETR